MINQGLGQERTYNLSCSIILSDILRCGVCNTAFSDYSTLRRHMWRHRDSKPYSCQFCGFTCIQSTQIKSHYKNKHGMSPTDAKKLIR